MIVVNITDTSSHPYTQPRQHTFDRRGQLLIPETVISKTNLTLWLKGFRLNKTCTVRTTTHNCKSQIFQGSPVRLLNSAANSGAPAWGHDRFRRVNTV